MVTVSPKSTAPLVGDRLSAISVEPAATIETKGAATVVVAVAVLLLVLGSDSFAEMLAEVDRFPDLVVATTTVKVALEPLAREPISHIIMLPERLVVPWVGVADTK